MFQGLAVDREGLGEVGEAIFNDVLFFEYG